MASAATVGALRIDLGMNSAQFEAGIKKAENGLQQFSNSAAKAGASATMMAEQAQKAAMRASVNARQLSFQLIDIGQAIPLAFQSPIYALQNVGFQIAQIGQLYAGQGGLKAALVDSIAMVGRFAKSFLPLTAVVGAVTGLFAGLTYEINKTATTQVSFGNVFMATLQVAADGIRSVLGPAVSQIGTWLGQLWDFIAPGLKAVGNGIVATFVGAFNASKIAWGAFPRVMGDIAYTTANNVIGGVEVLVNGAIGLLNQFIDLANQIPGLDLDRMDDIEFGGLENPFTGALTDTVRGIAGAFGNAFGVDFMGQAFDAISQRAQQLALVKDEADKAAGSAKKLGKALTDAAKAAREEWNFYRNTFSGFFGDLKGGLQDGKSLWESFGMAAANALDNIANRALEMAANGIFDMIFGSLFGGVGLGAGAIGRGVYGGGGGFFPAFPGFANGTNFAPGGLAWVGERGPELVNLPRGSQVIPNDALRGGLGGITVNVDARGAQVGVAEQLDQWARFKLPSIIRHHAATTLPEAG